MSQNTVQLGHQRCQCAACGEYFNSVRAFDEHRTGRYKPDERRCLTPAEMTARGMTKDTGVGNATTARLARKQREPIFWIGITHNRKPTTRSSV